MAHEDDDTIFIIGGFPLVATTYGPDAMRWSARTPAELIAKLDADGIDRKRLEVVVCDDLCCPDHAVSPKHAAAFSELLSGDISLRP